jgi:3-oxoacyl-[acyl-carrier protein] reductase
MDLGLAGRRALVGGGSRGLGAAIASVLAAEGARTALVARPSEELERHAAQIGGEALGIDLGAADGPAMAVRAAAERLGGIDLLVVNSGGPPAGDFDDLSEQDWSDAIAGTLLSAIRLIREAAPILRASDVPALLVVLSSSIREPIPGLVTSNVLRPGLVGLVKSLVGEYAPIRINGIAPGRIATGRVAHLDERRAAAAGVATEEIRRRTVERVPLGRYGEPEEVGRVAAFLLSPAASYVNGSIVSVDGGMIRSLP